MKRMMTIALVLLVGLAASAQGKWHVSHRQADELMGQEARDVYDYAVQTINGTHKKGRYPHGRRPSHLKNH